MSQSTSETPSQAPNPAPNQPVFERREDQLLYYVKRFVKFCVDILRKCGKDKLPDEERINQVVEAIPFEYYMKYVWQINTDYGEKLKEGDVDTVARVFALCSPFGETAELTRDMETFTNWLRANEPGRKKFFLYWTVISQIVDADSTTK
jgi:hypothetical protein